MSITFFLKSSETCYPACPACGGRMSHDPVPDRECRECDGYGPFPISNTPEMNVSNVNAWAILSELLGYGDEVEPCGGELDPEDVKRRLSVAKATSIVKATRREGRMIDCGRTLEQSQSYIDRLNQLADLASRRREPILYG